MTTFHDGPPPQSRRAARESERAALTTSQGVDYTAFAAPSPTQQTDAELEKQESARPKPGGRRAQRPAGGPDAEPVFTRTRPEPSEPPVAPAEHDAPYTVRDFSPEGRRAAQAPSAQAAELDYHPQATPAAAWQPPRVDAPPLQAPPVQPTGQPMTRREMRAMQAAADAAAAAELVEPPAASASATALSNAIAEFEALTRNREGWTGAIPVVRPAVEADGPAAAPESFAGLGPAPSAHQRVELPPPESATPVGANGTVAPQVSDERANEDHSNEDHSNEDHSNDWHTNDWHTVEAPATAIPDAAEPVAFPFALQTSSSVLGVAGAPAPAPAPAEPASPPTDEVPVWARETQPWTPADVQTDAQADDDVAEDPIGEAEASAPEFSEPQVSRESYTPPVGHWSRQAELEDALPFETTLSREVGGSNISTTTSALILPSIPQSDFSGLINGTGEILITGTIELPSSLGTMGADSRHFDNPDVDHMFDAFDKELVSNDSQPVRAIRAVSTHTATRGVIQINTKPHSNRLLTAGIIAASVLILGVVGLLAVYVINNL